MKFSLRHLHYAICLHGDLWIPTVVRCHVLHSLIIENHSKSMSVHSGDGWALNFNASVSFWPVDTWGTSEVQRSFIVLLVLTFESRHFTNLELQKYHCVALRQARTLLVWLGGYEGNTAANCIYTTFMFWHRITARTPPPPPPSLRVWHKCKTWKEKDARSLKIRWEEPDASLWSSNILSRTKE